MNAEIWLNGERLGTRGSMERPLTRNWNRPLLFDVPASLWREGENVIHARLAIHPHFGTMAPIIVGPRTALQADHDRRQFTQIDLNRIFFVLTIAIALLAFAFWLRRRGERVYLYLAGACLVLVDPRCAPVRVLRAPVRGALVEARAPVFGSLDSSPARRRRPSPGERRATPDRARALDLGDRRRGLLRNHGPGCAHSGFEPHPCAEHAHRALSRRHPRLRGLASARALVSRPSSPRSSS